MTSLEVGPALRRLSRFLKLDSISQHPARDSPIDSSGWGQCSGQVAVPSTMPMSPDWAGPRCCSYERGAAGAAAAVVAVGVAAGQVGRGHERVALVRTPVLGQRVHALLAAGLPGVGHGAVAVDVSRQKVHAVLGTSKQRRALTGAGPIGQSDARQRRGGGVCTQMSSCVITTLPLRQDRWSALRPSASPHVSLTCCRLPWARSSTTERRSSSAVERSSCWPSDRSGPGSEARKRRCSYLARIQRSRSSLMGQKTGSAGTVATDTRQDGGGGQLKQRNEHRARMHLIQMHLRGINKTQWGTGDTARGHIVHQSSVMNW